VVTRCRAAASSNGLGPGVSIVTAVPPDRQGKISCMPSPKVKAIGAEQVQRSSWSGRRMCRAKLSAGARMSR
jgi:hypothetical protein